MLELRFQAVMIEWRGPAPFFYVPIPDRHSSEIRHAAKLASYGWGVVPVDAVIAGVGFYTALFPKDGDYLLPVKAEVRRRTGVTVGDLVDVEMTIRARMP